jgi:hypothetical protein
MMLRIERDIMKPEQHVRYFLDDFNDNQTTNQINMTTTNDNRSDPVMPVLQRQSFRRRLDD